MVLSTDRGYQIVSIKIIRPINLTYRGHYTVNYNIMNNKHLQKKKTLLFAAFVGRTTRLCNAWAEKHFNMDWACIATFGVAIKPASKDKSISLI